MMRYRFPTYDGEIIFNPLEVEAYQIEYDGNASMVFVVLSLKTGTRVEFTIYKDNLAQLKKILDTGHSIISVKEA